MAECVEHRDQRDVLLNMGCTLFQGDLFSMPLSVQDFERYVMETAQAAEAEGRDKNNPTAVKGGPLPARWFL